MFIVVVAVPEHPSALLPVTVYVIVVGGVAITADPIVEVSPVEGFQEKEFAPCAVKVMELPAHMKALFGETLMLILSMTLIVVSAVFVQLVIGSVKEYVIT